MFVLRGLNARAQVLFARLRAGFFLRYIRRHEFP